MYNHHPPSYTYQQPYSNKQTFQAAQKNPSQNISFKMKPMTNINPSNPVVESKRQTANIENKHLLINTTKNIKEYQDQQETLNVKNSDSHEVKDLKNKIKTVMIKLSNTKKQKDTLSKENKSLSEQVSTLQSNLRQMISGFANTSSDFPIPNELATKVAQFYKYECLDKFFELLSNEDLSMKGVIYFYSMSFVGIYRILNQHFKPAYESLMKVGCFGSLQGPVMNVLRKAFQTSYKKILSQVYSSGKLKQVALQIQTKIDMTESEQISQEITDFLTKLTQILLCTMICDPPLIVNYSEIGRKVLYNPLIHDPFDGFIKPKEDCWIILPQVRKSSSIDTSEIITKSLVLHVDYFGDLEQK